MLAGIQLPRVPPPCVPKTPVYAGPPIGVYSGDQAVSMCAAVSRIPLITDDADVLGGNLDAGPVPIPQFLLDNPKEWFLKIPARRPIPCTPSMTRMYHH